MMKITVFSWSCSSTFSRTLESLRLDPTFKITEDVFCADFPDSRRHETPESVARTLLFTSQQTAMTLQSHWLPLASKYNKGYMSDSVGSHM